MYGRPLLCLLALSALTLSTEQRKLHRLVGGHLRIISPESSLENLELINAAASGSREKKRKSEQEEKKTLSQQVADGKYALIQKELFSKPSKRPGVLSYEENPEVPKDNIKNLGGLNKNEIWLAENHLLVLKGGTYPPHDEKQDHVGTIWPPIDNYNAPLHQVKIPAHPKVPPPFPVQFTDDGPLQILGTNFSRTLNGTIQSTEYAVPPPDGYQSEKDFPTYYPYPSNTTAWQAPLPIPRDPSGDSPQGAPFPPFLLNGTLPPFLASLPPGAAILPPPSNQTDLYDEDDPSIYYPPPYSFYYPKDNSSLVPPGPLVPGIILPPPPNFFAPLEEITTTTKKPLRHRKPTTMQTNPQLYLTTTPLSATSESIETTKKPIKVYPVQGYHYTSDVKSTITTTVQPNLNTNLPMRQLNRTYLPQKSMQSQKQSQNVTVLKSMKTYTPPPRPHVHENEIFNKPYTQYSPSNSIKKPSIITTQAPLKYYSTSNRIETNLVTQGPEKFQNRKKTTLKPVQYYYYEELDSDVTTQRTPSKQNTYFQDYYIPTKSRVPARQRKPQYILVTTKPYSTQKPRFRFIQQPAKSDSFSIHIARLQSQIHQYYTTPAPTYRPSIQSAKPVYQYSFQAADYQQQHNKFKPSQPDLNQPDQFRPIPKYSVQIQQAIEIIPTELPTYKQNPPNKFYQQTTYQHTTERPNYQYKEVTDKTKYSENLFTTRPITQYSFGVTPNPVYQGYHTKPDDIYFDDNTKQYFTVFGKKLPGATSPLPVIEQTTIKPKLNYMKNNQPQQASYYQQKPISLESDTVVNYVNPRPTVSLDAELIEGYPKVVKYTAIQPVQREKNPEIIKAIPVEVQSNDGRDGSFISYQLPGDDGAHFYFLTPQLAKRHDQGASFFYSQSNTPRTHRNEGERDKES